MEFRPVPEVRDVQCYLKRASVGASFHSSQAGAGATPDSVLESTAVASAL